MGILCGVGAHSPEDESQSGSESRSSSPRRTSTAARLLESKQWAADRTYLIKKINLLGDW